MKMDNSRPLISVIMPCFNEAASISNSIRSLMDDYFLENCELVVVDGMSTDRTPEVVQSFMKIHPAVRMMENKRRWQVFGLNLGISAARGDIIVRADAHCLFPPHYVRDCVELLHRTGAANVGGVMYPRGEGVTQKAIALAMRHPMGVGDARFHLGRFSGYVDTVYLGTFRKNLFQEIGLYDPNCRTNEDAELNVRMLKRGNKIYLDSRIQVTYFPRKSFRELGRQYFRYGRGRCYTTLKHKRMTSLRQAASPALVLFLVSTVLLGLWKPLLFLLPLPYFFLLIWSAMRGWRGESVTAKERLLVIPAFFVMHICWGTGFLSYLLFPKKSSPENGGGTEAHG